MGLFNWFFSGREQTRDESEETQITPPVSDVLLQALLNNEVITREKALTLPAVSGAVDFICNCVASMPVKLYKYKQGKVEEIENDPRIKMLNSDTGDTLNAFQMKKAMVEDYLMGKGGYCYIKKNRNEVTGLYYVEDIYVTIMKNFKPIFKEYVILVEGQEYKDYDFIKLLRNTKDGASGVGVTVEVSKALETAYQTLLYQLSLVQSGGNKRGFLKSQRKLAQSEIDTLKNAWKRMYANNNESVVVLNNGIEFQESSNSSVEMQLDQNKKTLTNEINNIFHIHPDNFDLTFKFAIYPIIKAFEVALNRDLLLEKEKKNMFFEFDVKEIVKASLSERYQAYKLAKETGFMTLNEIRRAENMNYIEGLDVVNVGLGAVLYDTNTHTYYTPNTDTVGSPNDGVDTADQDTADEEKMIENHELAEAFDESGNSAERIIERYNDVHGKDGRFGSKGGSGGSSGSSGSGGSDNDAKIKELEAQMAKTSRFGSGATKRKELQAQIDKLKGENGKSGNGQESEKKSKQKEFDEQKAKAGKTEPAKQANEQEYMMSHRPTKTGMTADDLTNQNHELSMPKDMYDKPQKYFDMSDKATQESISALKKVKGKPDAMIDVYRATVGDKINDGDWVTLSKSYAQEHNAHSLNGKGNIIKMTVPVGSIHFAGDDIREWGYFPTQGKEET